MKRIVFCTCTVILVLTLLMSCTVPVSDQEECQSGLYNAYTAGRCVAEGKDGFYISSGSLLYFLNPESGDCYPLCARPNCRHGEDEACQAYFEPLEGTYTPVFYADGQLYVVSVNSELPSERNVQFTGVSADGTTRQLLYQFSYTEIASSNGLAVHRGYLYAVLHSLTENGSSSAVCRYPLKSRGEREVLLNSEDVPEYANFSHIFADGDCVYFLADDTGTGKLVSLRLKTDGKGEPERLFDIGDESHGTGETRVWGDALFCTLADDELREEALRDGRIFCKKGYVQEENGELQYWGEVPEGAIVTDEQYLYELDFPYAGREASHALRIYDREGTQLLEENLNREACWSLRVGQEWVLIGDRAGQSYRYFEKANIGKGKLNWRETKLTVSEETNTQG